MKIVLDRVKTTNQIIPEHNYYTNLNMFRWCFSKPLSLTDTYTYHIHIHILNSANVHLLLNMIKAAIINIWQMLA